MIFITELALKSSRVFFKTVRYAVFVAFAACSTILGAEWNNCVTLDKLF